MLLKAKHNFFIYPFFQWYALWKINKVFHKVELVGKFESTERSILVLPNHIGWWDGFWIMYLNLKKKKKKFHFMMLHEQLQRFWFFNYTGAFSVQKGSRSIIETLKYTAEILNNNHNMVFVFPQGKICSLHQKPIFFEAGIEKILRYTKSNITILFVANLIDYYSNPKPSLYIHLHEYTNSNLSTKAMEDAYNQFYNEAVFFQTQKEQA